MYGLRMCTDSVCVCVCVCAVTGFGIRGYGSFLFCWPTAIYVRLSSVDDLYATLTF
jgi:hypothetical protein